MAKLTEKQKKAVPKSQRGVPGKSGTGSYPMPITYLAGLVDGEGCIRIRRDYTLELKISMSNEAVLKSVQETFGGRLYGPYKHSGIIHHKRVWEWHITSDGAYRLLKRLRPHMIVKRNEADCAVEFGHYKYVWSKTQPGHNQHNPVGEDEMTNREIWRLALMAYKGAN